MLAEREQSNIRTPRPGKGDSVVGWAQAAITPLQDNLPETRGKNTSSRRRYDHADVWLWYLQVDL